MPRYVETLQYDYAQGTFLTPLASTQSAKTPTILESLKLNPLKQKAQRKLPKHSKLLRLALWHEPRIASEADAHAMQEKDSCA